MKAFLYARVSTEDQNEGMQLREMRELAGRRGFEVEEFTDAGVSSAAARRPAFDRMMALVRRGKADVVMVYRFDRLARTVQKLIGILEEFRTIRVELISVHEAIDTTTPGGKLMFHMIAAFAEFERDLIRERTRSGMAHARAQGKHIGRPRVSLDTEKITSLRALGSRWEDISKSLGVPESTLRRLHRLKNRSKRYAETGENESLESTV